jgi:nicotinamidase/pyrazinamidase
MTEWKAPPDTAFIGVDITNDFIPNEGALMVEGGDQVIPVINAITPHFETVIWTKEEHDAHHDFFASSHPGKKPLDTIETDFGIQFLWPDHCVKGTLGAEFHKDLLVNEKDIVVVKGTDKHIHAYSAVYMDDRKTEIRYEDGKTLAEKLRDQGISRVAVTGLAYDFCAGLTAYDLAKEGFEVLFIQDASRAIRIPIDTEHDTATRMHHMLAEAGVITTSSKELPTLLTRTSPKNTL